jgi:hypothetical protein
LLPVKIENKENKFSRLYKIYEEHLIERISDLLRILNWERMKRKRKEREGGGGGGGAAFNIMTK